MSEPSMGESAPRMLGVDEARERILMAVGPLPSVEVPLDEAPGAVLARDVAARDDLPPFDNSAMDGFALIAADTEGASADAPVALAVAGTVAAGHVWEGSIGSGQAVRIMTGAPVPEGADAVERVEKTIETDDGRVVLRHPVPPGTNIRPAGEEMKAGETALSAGTRVTPGAIGLLAAAGHDRVMVHRRPRVGVLVTGDELVPPGDLLGSGQIRDSNGPMIAALVRHYGGVPVPLGRVADSADALRERIGEAAGLDLLLTSGGVSVGDVDVVKDVMRAEGEVELWRVRLRPGGPLAFGRVGGMVVLGLPGNPAAAAVAAHQFGAVVIMRMLGCPSCRIPEIKARVGERIVNRRGRRQFVRVRLYREAGEWVARLAGGQGSAMLTSLAQADGLLVIPEECEVAEPGMVLPVQVLEGCHAPLHLA